jgi:RHH-type proline utilization regulon transcriptional repressor/proline dehydrogenase/delta 1-pyrroline-5-carboxylate dehydrogenase
VIAKPAEQTPLIAALAVKLCHEAGIPPEAFQLLPGAGQVGQLITADPRLAGVAFTGSTETARAINCALANRDGPIATLIAETGGQNAMIVDSSALPEQVVRDVLGSAFQSAGQRCSALRVLYLQEDIAGTVLEMIHGGFAALKVGDPAELATDVGPVIDAEAKGLLEAHIAESIARGFAVTRLPGTPATGHFVAPTIIEIGSIGDLARENFGPVLHIALFSAGELEQVVDAINATGYGLTLGLHSRIAETRRLVQSRARVGNFYVNRNQIGAVVESQPFGGEGLSGTGPKAGGPLYLHRLAGAAEVRPASIGARRESGSPGLLPRLAEWAAATGLPAIAVLCADYAGLSLLDTVVDLPGPTGERNTLRFAPRGRLLCLAADRDGLLRQLAAVWATGNVAATVASPDRQKLIAALPDDLAVAIEWRPPDDCAGLAGVLAEAGTLAAGDRQLLAMAPGPLIAIYQPAEKGGHYPLYRMLAERVVSINTTAAGGNATLMMLA